MFIARRLVQWPWSLYLFRRETTAAVSQELENVAEAHADKSERDKRLIDQVRVLARAGNGGAGCDSLWKSSKKGKFRPPDGGSGGCGGDVVVQASSELKDLRGIRYLQLAGNGGHGLPQKKTGTHGTDKLIKVPLGTIVRVLQKQGAWEANAASTADAAPVKVLSDLSVPGAAVVVAQGGAGGRGNAAFGRRQNRPALRDRELGQPGEEHLLQLELKLLADVGFVGAPNAGKSTLLRALSRARPMVGSYAFTTLEPQLGVVLSEDMRLLVADIPGLVAGASQNKGLGHAFLRHVERTRVLAFVVDLASGVHGRDGLHPSQQLSMLQEELSNYSEALMGKPALVVANKVDLLGSSADAIVAELVSNTQLRVIVISAQSGTGIDAVRQALLEKVHQMSNRVT